MESIKIICLVEDRDIYGGIINEYKDVIPEVSLKKEENYRSTNADYAIFLKRREKFSYVY